MHYHKRSRQEKVFICLFHVFWYSQREIIGPRIESALQEAKEVYDAIKIYNLTERQKAAEQELAKAEELLNNVTDFRDPLEGVDLDLRDLDEKQINFQIRLNDLYNNTEYSLGKTIEAEDLIKGHT